MLETRQFIHDSITESIHLLTNKMYEYQKQEDFDNPEFLMLSHFHNQLMNVNKKISRYGKM